MRERIPSKLARLASAILDVTIRFPCFRSANLQGKEGIVLRLPKKKNEESPIKLPIFTEVHEITHSALQCLKDLIFSLN